MKQLRSLSIQGWEASSLWFKHQDAQGLRSLIESMTLSCSCIVSSIYRTDIFYIHNKDLSAPLTKIWLSMRGASEKGRTLMKSISISSGRNRVLENYFGSLSLLMLHPTHYQRYRDRINELLAQDPKNPILREIVNCDEHLVKLYGSGNTSYIRLTDQVQPRYETNPGLLITLSKMYEKGFAMN